MLRNFLLITFRNFLKNKSFVIINVLGLGIGIACCIIAYYNNKFNADFDSFHSQKEDIYKISLTREVNNRQQQYGFTPLSLAPAIGNSISGLDQIVRLTHSTMPVRFEENIFSKRIAFADSNFFEVFDLSMISGKGETIKDEKSVIISKEFAGICFGTNDPIGKILKFYSDSGEESILMVSGIFEDLPENSSMQFDLLCHIDNLIEINKIEEHDWKSWVAATFLLIQDESKVGSIEEQLARFIPIQNDIRKDWLISGFYIEPLKDIPSTGREIWANWLFAGLHPAALIAPTVMAVLLLLLACLNFTNTALAISSRRLKEIGLRKVFGGVRSQTMLQFLGENIILCFLALLVSLLMGYYLIDAYSNMWPYMTLKISLSDGLDFWLFLSGLLIVTGLVAGSYPAFYVSRFNPIRILKGDVKFSGGGLFSKILLVFQFILAITGIVSAVIFTQNAYFQNTLYLGYEKDKVIAVPVDDNSKLELFRNTIIQNPLINSIGQSEENIGWGNYSRTLKWGEEQEHEVQGFDIGKGYFETMGLELISGRYFDQDFMESERGSAIIVNEKFVTDFGWETAVGQKVKESDTIDLTVVGVLKDFYPYGFWAKISPTMLKLGKKEQMRMLVIQTDEKNLEQVNKTMQEEWEKLIPNSVYPGFFQTEVVAEAKDINNQIRKIFLFLAIVSVILSLVGLYTLVSLNIIKKTKEIGIRKVLGASVMNLTKLINRDFAIILLIASVIGSALGYYLSDMLLASIWTIYLDTSVLSFVIPVVFIFLVSVFTLSGKVYKAATRNPVDSIKYE